MTAGRLRHRLWWVSSQPCQRVKCEKGRQELIRAIKFLSDDQSWLKQVSTGGWWLFKSSLWTVTSIIPTGHERSTATKGFTQNLICSVQPCLQKKGNSIKKKKKRGVCIQSFVSNLRGGSQATLILSCCLKVKSSSRPSSQFYMLAGSCWSCSLWNWVNQLSLFSLSLLWEATVTRIIIKIKKNKK